MSDETGEKTPSVATPQPSAQEAELANLRAELDKTKQELNKMADEAKAHQRTASKKSQEAQEALDMKGRIEKLEKYIETQTAMLADLVDRGEVETQPVRQRPSETYLAKLKAETPQPKPEVKQPNQDFMDDAREADKLAREVGLDMENSDELTKAYNQFLKGNNARGLALTKEITEKIKKSKAEPAQKTLTEKDEEEIARKYMEKKGMLISDAGKPSGASLTKEQAREKYAKGELSHEDAIKLGIV